METITLNTGIELPIVGTGTNTYGKENNEYTKYARQRIQQSK